MGSARRPNGRGVNLEGKWITFGVQVSGLWQLKRKRTALSWQLKRKRILWPIAYGFGFRVSGLGFGENMCRRGGLRGPCGPSGPPSSAKVDTFVKVDALVKVAVFTQS